VNRYVHASDITHLKAAWSVDGRAGPRMLRKSIKHGHCVFVMLPGVSNLWSAAARSASEKMLYCIPNIASSSAHIERGPTAVW